MKKKAFIILSFFSLLAIITLIVFIKSKNNPTQQQVNTLATLKPEYQGSFGDIISNQTVTLQFPEKVPLLKLKHETLLNSYAFQVARNSGFSESANSTQDTIRGPVWYWTNSSGSLFVFTQNHTIEYNSTTPYNQATSQSLSDVSLVDSAKHFLTEKELLSEDEIGLASIRYLVYKNQYSGFEEGKRNDAILFEVTFSPKQADFKIVTQEATRNTIGVTMLADGTVWSAQVTKFVFVEEKTNPIVIKSRTQVMSEFTSKAVLMGVLGTNAVLGDLPENSIQSTQIKDLSLAYLWGSPQSTTLQPIFIITGESQVLGFDQPIKTLFYMYAQKDF